MRKQSNEHDNVKPPRLSVESGEVVRAALIEFYSKAAPTRLLTFPKTSLGFESKRRTLDRPEDWTYLKSKWPAIRDDTIQAYSQAACKRWRWPKHFRLGDSLSLKLTGDEFNEFKMRQTRACYPGFFEIFAASAAGISADGQQAMFYLHTEDGTYEQMGHGCYVILDRIGEDWIIAETVGIWIS